MKHSKIHINKTKISSDLTGNVNNLVSGILWNSVYFETTLTLDYLRVIKYACLIDIEL